MHKNAFLCRPLISNTPSQFLHYTFSGFAFSFSIKMASTHLKSSIEAVLLPNIYYKLAKPLHPSIKSEASVLMLLKKQGCFELVI
jgi:hypothetical protein